MLALFLTIIVSTEKKEIFTKNPLNENKFYNPNDNFEPNSLRFNREERFDTKNSKKSNLNEDVFNQTISRDDSFYDQNNNANLSF